MGHGIERIKENGLDIDCFGYAGEQAWHGLGQRVGERADPGITLGDMERAARADWCVVTDRVKTQTDDQKLVGVQALVRDRDRRVLGVATDRYSVIQHHDLGVLLDVLVQNGRASWETCSVLNDGQRVVFAVRLNTCIEALPGDETELFCVATTSHDGTATASLLLTGVRVVCANTLSLALSQNVERVTVRHTKGAGGALAQARDVILNVNRRVEQMDEAMAMLTRIVLKEQQVQRFLNLVVPIPELPPVDVFTGYAEAKRKRLLYEQDRAVRVQERIRELHETGEGNDIRGVRGSGYGWLNAVTHHATHGMRARSKIESNLVGEASKLGRRAYTALTEKASRDDILMAA